jgi:hypothetical protein
MRFGIKRYHKAGVAPSVSDSFGFLKIASALIRERASRVEQNYASAMESDNLSKKAKN